MHVHCADAEEEHLRNLAIGPADDDVTQHLELAPREALVAKIGSAALPETFVDTLAERVECRNGTSRERPCPQTRAVR